MTKHLKQMQTLQEQVNSAKQVEKDVKVLKVKKSDDGAFDKSLEAKLQEQQVEDSELADVAAVSAGNDYEIGNMIVEAMIKVGRKGVVVTLKGGKHTKNSLYLVKGMQFHRGYLSPYFVTDSKKMSFDHENCKVLLVDKITNAMNLVSVLEDDIKGGYPILIILEDVQHEVLDTLVVNKLLAAPKIVVLKSPRFSGDESQYLGDIAILTGGNHFIFFFISKPNE
ncbi:hypothetical protein L6452_22668 [Arctium lappa]|uniref:Uncharacterized protein n=1 Tax=Arctium lappa TaxID=4217 RepID=A0ACB9AZU2_ARCLA|nr:hypothetical protein L6452_22668 [Arctium lappa]